MLKVGSLPHYFDLCALQVISTLFIASVDLQFKNSGENGASCVSNAHAYEAICL